MVEIKNSLIFEGCCFPQGKLNFVWFGADGSLPFINVLALTFCSERLLMKSITRRQFVASGLGMAALGLSFPVCGISLDFLPDKKAAVGLTASERFKLSKAVLDVLETYYKGMTLQFWDKPFEQIDFEKRITNIVYWVDLAVKQEPGEYYVDPAWVMSQIMAESLFCELAISTSLAAGICQLMPNTATQSYQMVIAGSQKDHYFPPYKKLELANSLSEYRQRIKERSVFKKSTKGSAAFNLEKALRWLAEGKSGQAEAQLQLARNKATSKYNEKIKQAKKGYVTYINANIDELGQRDIFGNSEFFVGFDERFTYKKPIFAMVHMLSNALRVRSGNMLAAAAAYNAGLSRTWTDEALYTRYGQLPNYSETNRYLSRIIANYEEITLRYRA